MARARRLFGGHTAAQLARTQRVSTSAIYVRASAGWSDHEIVAGRRQVAAPPAVTECAPRRPVPPLKRTGRPTQRFFGGKTARQLAAEQQVHPDTIYQRVAAGWADVEVVLGRRLRGAEREPWFTETIVELSTREAARAPFRVPRRVPNPKPHDWLFEWLADPRRPRAR